MAQAWHPPPAEIVMVMCVGAYICMSTGLYVCMYVCMYVCLPAPPLWGGVWWWGVCIHDKYVIYICMYIYIHTYIYIHIKYICKYVWCLKYDVCIYEYVYIYTYIHTYIHIHVICIHTHARVPKINSINFNVILTILETTRCTVFNDYRDILEMWMDSRNMIRVSFVLPIVNLQLSW